MKYFFCLFMLCTLRLMGNTGGDTLVPLGKVMYRFETKCDRHALQNGRVSLYFNSFYSMCLYEDVPKKSDIIENSMNFQTIEGDPDKMLQFVDFSRKQIAYKQFARFLPRNIVKEELPSIKWHIQTETKAIAGRKCQKATCSLGGRNYIAWFCAELPYAIGPYKFTGLPGVIFEIVSTDGFVKYTFAGIEIKKNPLIIMHPPTHGKIFVSKNKLIEADKAHYEIAKKKVAAYAAEKGIRGGGKDDYPTNYFIEKEYEWGGGEFHKY